MNKAAAILKLDAALNKYGTAFKGSTAAALPASLGRGKAYELHCIAAILEELGTREHWTFRYHGGATLPFRLGGGRIGGPKAHIDSFNAGGKLIGTIWTAVDFVAASAHASICSVSGSSPGKGQRHELDIALVDPAASADPCHEHILLGVECKERIFTNALLKEVLGVRREMTMLSPTGAALAGFKDPQWRRVPANPASWMVVMCSSVTVAAYSAPGDFFGIKFLNV